MKKEKISWGSVVLIVMYAIIFGIFGIGLSEVVNNFNGLGEGHMYGYFASHAIIAIIFWVFVRDIKITKPLELNRKEVK